jgi:hypothetical protein
LDSVVDVRGVVGVLFEGGVLGKRFLSCIASSSN